MSWSSLFDPNYLFGKESRSFSSRWFFRWLDGRIPVAKHYTLNRHNLYTFPTKLGFLLIFLTIILWLLGTNYQNNLILALSYLLISLFVVSILHAYRNMAGMHISINGVKPDFVGATINFYIDFQSGNAKGSHNLVVRWNPGNKQNLDYCPSHHMSMAVPSKAKKRGHFYPGRMMLESIYPLGLIRCWTWLKMDASSIVFPEPVAADTEFLGDGTGYHDREPQFSGGDEFWGLRNYQPGDYIKRMAWKQYARGGELLTKQFAQPGMDEAWLEWEQFAALGYEQRISALCFWALQFNSQNREYGLRIPGTSIEPSSGEAHRIKVLTALALMEEKV